MRHRKRTFKIGRTSAHRRAMLANMACSAIVEGQIQTTVTKAKELRRVVDRMITLGKRGTLHARRRAIAVLRQPAVVRVLFDEVAPKYSDRQGGYTRVLKLNRRVGDAAEMCILELVNEPVTPKSKSGEQKPADKSVADTDEATDKKTKAEVPEAEDEAEVAAEATADEEKGAAEETDEKEDEEAEKG
ncbi:MAG: 50S ribosomal protein L17 [Candidatus Pacebacteria bacterium]|nr:50S ribosomal protein L17 [Candidatus Paceibacterota bacterium]